MKIILSLVLPFFLMASYISKSIKKTGNPVFSGWYADPEAAILEGKYWIFPTYSAPFEEQTFFDAFSSDDLRNWIKHEKIIDASSIKWLRHALWAPSILKKDGRYFLFFGANDIQTNEELGGIGVGVSDKPEGPYEDYLGKPLIDKIHNGAQPIDQFVFEDNGKFYLFYGGWKHCNVAQLNSDFTGFIPFEDGTTFKEVTPENYKEGSFMFKRNGKYYFMWSEGSWTNASYSVAYAIADSPIGPFKRIGKVLEQDDNIGRGAGHHSVIKHPRTGKYYIVYHRRPLNETDRNSRVICIDRMHFDENGLIKKVKMTHDGVAPSPLK